MSPAAQLALTASQVVDALRCRRLAAAEYVRTLLARAAQLAELNSFITLDTAGALAAAARIDSLRASGAALPALAGVPIVVKDNIDTAGLPTTGGTPALRDVRPSANAPVLQRLLDAGAIVLGKTNMHELGYGVTNTNLSPFAGAVRNPYDPARVPGGSSGGTAAAVAARIAPAGLGTDTGGSVRIPAAFCGLAGLRPSVGNGRAERRYDAAGVLPISRSRDTIGPIASTMRDVALLDAVMSGSVAAAAVPLTGMRFGVPRLFWADLDSEIAAVVESAVAKLRAKGVVLVDVDTEDLADLTRKGALAIALHEARGGIPRYLASVGRQDITLADIAAEVASPDVKRILDVVVNTDLTTEYELAMNSYRPRMQALYARCFAEHALDALIFPTVAVLPPLVDMACGSPPNFFAAAIRNTDPGSTAGLPGITVPAGLTSTGLPVGLALDGPIGGDRRLIGLGISIESILGSIPAATR